VRRLERGSGPAHADRHGDIGRHHWFRRAAPYFFIRSLTALRASADMVRPRRTPRRTSTSVSAHRRANRSASLFGQMREVFDEGADECSPALSKSLEAQRCGLVYAANVKAASIAAAVVTVACVGYTAFLSRSIVGRSIAEMLVWALAGPVLGTMMGAAHRQANPRADTVHWVMWCSLLVLLFRLFVVRGRMI
jgi:hypothetical protein